MNLTETFKDFKDGKNIDRPTMMRVLEDVFRTLIKKKYGSDDNFDVIVNTNTGDLELWRRRTIVPDGEVTDELTEISITEALELDSDYEVEDECNEKVDTEEFGRRAVMAARQTLVSRIMELEKDEIFKRYEDRIGDLITGEINQVLGKEVLVLDDATGQELVLPKTEMIRGDFFRKGESTRGVIKKVEMRNNLPVITLSRTEPMFLEKLMITIKKIVRIPGERAKVAVESYDDRIDPVGACVGMKGSRIHGIVRELRNENIDIVNFTNNIVLYIQRSLTPAKITDIQIFPETMRASVYLKPDQVSLAIGKSGSNIKLATKLTGYEFDVFRDTDEMEIDDVELDEFADEIDGWVLDALKGIGCDTARSVLKLTVEELVRRADLEEDTAREVIRILEAELEDE